MFKGKKVAFYTLGCKLNFSETSTIGRQLYDIGFSKTEFEKTFPFSEPGELSPDTDLLAEKYSFSVESISSYESMKLRIGTVRNSKQIVAARYFCTGIILDIHP